MTRPRPDIDPTPVLLNPDDFPRGALVDWAAVFAGDGPLEIEIGSGKGLFLLNAAAARPDHRFLGVELARSYARMAAERIVRRGTPNIRMWPGDGKELLANRVADASLRAVHVYFPDPWWKKRHKKRRVFSEGLVASIVRTLEPDGELHVATDVEEYFTVMTGLVATEPRLAALSMPEVRDPEHDLDYLTHFERKFRMEGRAIYRASYRRVEPASPAADTDPDASEADQGTATRS